MYLRSLWSAKPSLERPSDMRSTPEMERWLLVNVQSVSLSIYLPTYLPTPVCVRVIITLKYLVALAWSWFLRVWFLSRHLRDHFSRSLCGTRPWCSASVDLIPERSQGMVSETTFYGWLVCDRCVQVFLFLLSVLKRPVSKIWTPRGHISAA